MGKKKKKEWVRGRTSGWRRWKIKCLGQSEQVYERVTWTKRGTFSTW